MTAWPPPSWQASVSAGAAHHGDGCHCALTPRWDLVLALSTLRCPDGGPWRLARREWTSAAPRCQSAPSSHAGCGCLLAARRAGLCEAGMQMQGRARVRHGVAMECASCGSTPVRRVDVRGDRSVRGSRVWAHVCDASKHGRSRHPRAGRITVACLARRSRPLQDSRGHLSCRRSLDTCHNMTCATPM